MNLTLLLSMAAFAAEDPTLHLSWRGDTLTLRVQAPPGEHIAPEAPVSAWLQADGRMWSMEGDGAALEGGLALGMPGRGAHAVGGSLSFSLCEDNGSACRVVEGQLSAEPKGRRGKLVAPWIPGWLAPDGEEAHGHSTLPPNQVFAQAQAEGRLVLLDFSAVWCPPCNLMTAEVLADPADSAALSPYVLSVVDVDQASSWDLKTRYAVRGYPTLIAARPDGTLIDRLEGYPGEAELLAWLEHSAAEQLSLEELLAQKHSLSGAEAGHAALRLARAGQPIESAALIARSDMGLDARIARVLIDPKEEDLLWLCENGRDRIMEWAFEVDGVPLSAQGSAALRATLASATALATPAHASDLLYVQAGLAPPEQAPALYAAAAALLRQNLTGDPALDRGYYTSIADVTQLAGDPEAALAILQEAASLYPHEFTFYYAAAGLLRDEGRAEEALPWILAAEAVAYGDNHLRAVRRHAEILRDLGRKDEALALLDATLAEAALPAQGQQVRTTRYVGDLEKLRGELRPAP